MGAPPAESAPPPPGRPFALAGDNAGAQSSKIEGVPPRYVYIHTPLRNAQLINRVAYAKVRKRDTDCIPDLPTDEGTYSGQYTICCMVMQLTSILQMTAAC